MYSRCPRNIVPVTGTTGHRFHVSLPPLNFNGYLSHVTTDTSYSQLFHWTWQWNNCNNTFLGVQ